MPGILSNEQIEFIRAAINTHGSGSLGPENQSIRKAFDAMLKDYADLEKYYDERENKHKLTGFSELGIREPDDTKDSDNE